jgi:cbb3-type cytochrome oxidase subunit 3
LALTILLICFRWWTHRQNKKTQRINS